jgi:dTDP-4-amino-4,6-dideoxygalactose transaminase
MAISEETGIPVVEDVSHAHGARYKGRMCGSIGAAGCWSLQGSKPVSAGEGGVMVTDDEECFERACLVGQVNRIKGVDLVTEKYSYLQPLGLGIKLRSHPLSIGIASVQLDRLDELNARRRAYVEAVEEGIKGIPGLNPVKTYEGAERAGFYGFPVLHDPEAMGGLSTQAFREAVCNEGITVNDGGYPLLHALPLFADGFDVFTRGRGPLCGDYPGYKDGDFPVTEKMARHLVFLPVLSDPKPGAADQVVSALERVANRADKLAATQAG